MKWAYSVSGDETGCLVYANNRFEARSLGAAQLECSDPFEITLSTRRMPTLDRFDGPHSIPIRDLIEAGFQYHCDWCDKLYRILATTAIYHAIFIKFNLHPPHIQHNYYTS